MSSLRPGGLSDEEFNSDDDFEAEDIHSFRSNKIENGLSVGNGFGSINVGNGSNPAGKATKSVSLKSSTRLGAGLKGNKCYNGTVASTVVSSSANELVTLDDLRSAVQKNSVDSIRTILSHGVDVNSPMSSGWTALMYAAHCVATDSMQCLLQQGADANSHKDKYTTLMAACGSTSSSESLVLKSVQLLLEHGADVNACDRHDMTPLMYAAREGRVSVIEVLLPLASDLNQQDDKGYTALMWATSSGHIEVVKTLLSAGVDLTKQKADGKRAVDIAAAKGHGEILQLLKNKMGISVDIPARYSNGLSPSSQNGFPASTMDCAKESDDRTNGGINAMVSNLNSSSRTNVQAVTSVQSTSSDVAAGGDGRFQLSSAGSANSLASGIEKSPDVVKSETDKDDSAGGGNVLVYGELEIFLSGLDLAALIPVFHEHKVTFQTFLRMTDSDLKQMNISQIGIRKKILDAIRETHKKNWETTSLMSIQYNKKISCSEAVLMLTNIKQHAAYIASTIGYIDDQITADNKIVLDAPQEPGIGVKDLTINTEEAITNVKNLFAELVLLRRHLEKICHNRDFQAPELVPKRRRAKRRWRRLVFFGGVVVGCTTIAVVLGKSLQR